MKPYDECENLGEIRAEIDNIDKQIIEQLGIRFGYVKAAAKFKNCESSVRAPERFASMLEQRREWAGEVGLSPDAVEKLYRDLVNHFIEEELKEWKEKN